MKEIFLVLITRVKQTSLIMAYTLQKQINARWKYRHKMQKKWIIIIKQFSIHT